MITSRSMNRIETNFYDSYLSVAEEPEKLEPRAVIDIYEVDFLYDNKFVIEIDGHEAHKTKEQRFKDCKRERYLMAKGYIVIRFTGSEVFVGATECIEEMFEIINVFTKKYFKKVK